MIPVEHCSYLDSVFFSIASLNLNDLKFFRQENLFHFSQANFSVQSI